MKRVAAAAAFAALFAAIAWWLSWSSVRALLAQDAQRRVAAWEQGATPWRWDLAQDNAVVWPGSTGFEREPDATGDLLFGRVPDGNADLSLDLHGEAVDLALLRGAMLWLPASTPVRVSFFAERDGATVALAPRVEAANGIVVIPFDPPLEATTRLLRLHLETEPGARVALGALSLLPRQPYTPQPCSSLASCTAPVPRLAAPDFAFPESLLAWRDLVVRERAAAIVDMDEAGGATAFAQRVLARAGEARIAWLLLLAPIVVGVFSRLRRTPTTRRLAFAELALVFAPWLLLQWAGVPGDEAPARADWAAFGGVIGALLLKPHAAMRWWGDIAAWRALWPFALAAALTIVVLAASSGFETRALPWSKAWQYPLWAALQQVLLMHAIAPRMRILAGGDALAGALLAGGLFALLHLPNFALMLATFAAGSAWAGHGYRHRAVFPLVAVHVLAGVALLWATPPWLLRSAEVGGRYLMAP